MFLLIHSVVQQTFIKILSRASAGMTAGGGRTHGNQDAPPRVGVRAAEADSSQINTEHSVAMTEQEMGAYVCRSEKLLFAQRPQGQDRVSQRDAIGRACQAQ